MNDTFGPFRLDDLLGRGPNAVVHRATRTSDQKRVALKIFNAGDDAWLRRVEDDSRRLIGLNHPNILKVESVGRESGVLHIVYEPFEGRSLRVVGSKSRRDAVDLLLKSARALGAAWMRLILHRDLKPENILFSATGDLKVCDFGQFRDATPYWAPERKSSQYADLRGDLYSLGAIFKEVVPAGDTDVDELLAKMTRVETFERVQMVEDVISRLESWMLRAPAPAATAPTPPAPPFVPPAYAPPPPVFPSWQPPDPALTTARTKLVGTLAAVSNRITRVLVAPPPPPPPPKIEMPVFRDPPKIEIPVTQAPPPPPPPKPRPAPPPYVPPPPPPPPAPARKRRGGFLGVVKTLVILAFIGGAIYFQSHQAAERRRRLEEAERLQQQGRADEARRRLEAQIRKSKDSTLEKDLLEKVKTAQWEQVKKAVLAKDAEGNSTQALETLDEYLAKYTGKAPEEATALRKSLNTWVSTVKQAEQSWKYGGDRRAADLLTRAGPDRAKDTQRILANWCDQDWEKVKVAVDKAVTGNDPYTANLEVERFLRKVHLGGTHKKEAEELQKQFQAEIDWPDVVDRVNTLKLRAPAEAASALDAFLAKPHGGGTHREEAQKLVAQLREDTKQLLYSGRSSVARLAVSQAARRVAYTADGIHIVDLESREEVASLPQRSLLRGLSFGAGDLVAVGTSAKITVWNRKTEGRSYSPSAGYVVGFVMADHKTVYAVLSDGSLVTWDSSADDPPKVEKDAVPRATSISLSADGSRIALASADRSVRVRETAGGKEWKWSGPPVSMTTVALGPDGKLLATGSANGMVMLWNVDTAEAGPAVTGHTGSVTCADFSPDGKLVATGGADAVIRVSSTRDGAVVKAFNGHRGRITSLAFLAGNVISSGSDGTVRVWPLK